MLHKRKIHSCVLALLLLCLTACSPAAAPADRATAVPTPAAQPLLHTSMGDFVIASAQLADEARGQAAAAGEKFLLLTLTEPDLVNIVPGEFSLETFQEMIEDSNGQVYVTGPDGAQYISTMAGWIEDAFTIGFPVVAAPAYTLNWPGNAPITLVPQE